MPASLQRLPACRALTWMTPGSATLCQTRTSARASAGPGGSGGSSAAPVWAVALPAPPRAAHAIAIKSAASARFTVGGYRRYPAPARRMAGTGERARVAMRRARMRRPLRRDRFGLSLSSGRVCTAPGGVWPQERPNDATGDSAACCPIDNRTVRGCRGLPPSSRPRSRCCIAPPVLATATVVSRRWCSAGIRALPCARSVTR